MTTNGPLFLSVSQVKKHLSWPAVYHAVEQALLSVSSSPDDKDLPNAVQPVKSLTLLPDASGLLFSMPGFIGNYSLPSTIRSEPKRFSTLACKLVTSFTKNQQLPEPLPNIIASICLFDTLTGRLKCILDATEITAWRTAAASLVATQHLYFARPNVKKDDPFNLAIVGCGAQGRIHAIGMCTMFNVARLNLWNRNKERADNLKSELDSMRSMFSNQMVELQVCDAVAEGTRMADVIVTATGSKVPVLMFDALKENAHINAVGAAEIYHSELDDLVYANSSIYVDSWAGAKADLKTLNHEIKGEIGEVMCGKKKASFDKCTIFQSMGMAVEDCTVAELVYELHQNSK